MSSHKAITPDSFPWFDYTRYTFSLGLEVGHKAYLSGHSASEYNTDVGHIVVEGGMVEQTETAYSKIQAILEAAGLGFDDVVNVVENVTTAGLDHYQEAESVRADVFGSVAPAVNTVVVERLLRPDALIEIEVTASREPGESYGVTSTGRAAYAPAARIDDVVYLSTVLPIDEKGHVVGKGDVVAQTRQIFENAATMLRFCGLDLSHVVRTYETVTPAALGSYKGTGRVRREFLGPVYPAAAGIVQARAAIDGDVLIAYDMVASRGTRTAVNPGWERYEKLTYSPAVRAGEMLFLAGQAALDPSTERAVHSGDIGRQAEYTYANIIRVLEAADMGPSNLIKTVEFVTPAGLRRYRDVASVREKALRAPWPSSTGALCHSLLRPEFEIEIIPLASSTGSN